MAPSRRVSAWALRVDMMGGCRIREFPPFYLGATFQSRLVSWPSRPPVWHPRTSSSRAGRTSCRQTTGEPIAWSTATIQPSRLTHLAEGTQLFRRWARGLWFRFGRRDCPADRLPGGRVNL